MLRACPSSQGHSTARPSLDGRALLCCGLEKNSMFGEWHGHDMASVNQTRPHCVNQMGKAHSKPLAARHDTAQQGNGMLCVNRPLPDSFSDRGVATDLGPHIGCPDCGVRKLHSFLQATFINYVNATKITHGLGNLVYCLLLFFYVRPADQPTITGVALCHDVGRP
jgi:hypothetical protein